MYYFNPSKADECRQQFRKAIALIDEGKINKARTLINHNTHYEVYDFALSLSASHSHKELNELKALVKFVICAIEIDRSKNWPTHYKNLRKKVLCEN